MDEYKLGDIPGVYNYGQEKIEDVDKVSKSYICSTRHWTHFTVHTLFCRVNKCKENTDI